MYTAPSYCSYSTSTCNEAKGRIGEMQLITYSTLFKLKIGESSCKPTRFDSSTLGTHSELFHNEYFAQKLKNDAGLSKSSVLCKLHYCIH
jgi:hypothetical protein